MKILLASLDCPGHNIPLRKINHALAQAGHEEVYWLSFKEDLTSASFENWAQRLFEAAPRQKATILRNIHDLKPDLLLTDFTILSALDIHKETGIPWAFIGISALLWANKNYPCIIQLTHPMFELPQPHLKKNLHFAGPILYSDLIPKPIPKRIHITQGTIATNRNDLINPAFEALMEDYYPTIDNKESLPITKFYKKFQELSILITNGGYAPINEALSYGIPIIVAGDTEEKRFVAERVVHAGVGISLETSKPKPGAILHAVKCIEEDSKYRKNALRFALATRGVNVNAPARVVEILETYLKEEKAA